MTARQREPSGVRQYAEATASELAGAAVFDAEGPAIGRACWTTGD